MAVEQDAEKLVSSQREVISAFFGTEVPVPSYRLFMVCEEIRQEKLWKPETFFVPQIRLPEGVSFPGLKRPLSSSLYMWMREKLVGDDADSLPGQWIIWDATRRPSYNEGRQMYPDTRRFKELLASLREREDGIEVPDYYAHVQKDSRFVISADEIDGSKNLVVGEIAKVLGLREGEIISTPSYAVFNYIGNLVHPELGKVDTSEWFRNTFEHGLRLSGGHSRFRGLSGVEGWPSGVHDNCISFRLQISFPNHFNLI